MFSCVATHNNNLVRGLLYLHKTIKSYPFFPVPQSPFPPNTHTHTHNLCTCQFPSYKIHNFPLANQQWIQTWRPHHILCQTWSSSVTLQPRRANRDRPTGSQTSPTKTSRRGLTMWPASKFLHGFFKGPILWETLAQQILRSNYSVKVS